MYFSKDLKLQYFAAIQKTYTLIGNPQMTRANTLYFCVSIHIISDRFQPSGMGDTFYLVWTKVHSALETETTRKTIEVTIRTC